MIGSKSVLAIIPARGGSKGLPRKNILPLCGKPLIVWTIQAAKNSKYVDRCIVSTDDFEISEVAEKFGADVPFIRPSALATDYSVTSDVVHHAINEMPKEYDLIVLLQPTSPLRNEVDIDSALECFMNSQAESLVSVTELEHPVEWSFVQEDGFIPAKNVKELTKSKRRQDFYKRYRLNGAIYICSISDFKTHKSFFINKIKAYTMDNVKSVDVDSEFDLFFAGSIIKNQLENL